MAVIAVRVLGQRPAPPRSSFEDDVVEVVDVSALWPRTAPPGSSLEDDSVEVVGASTLLGPRSEPFGGIVYWRA